MGFAFGSAVEGSPPRVSLVLDMSATTSGMGGPGRVAESLANVAGRTRRSPAVGLGGVLRRRQLCPGQKRGRCVGKTKRGKGTKWMVVASGQGIPLAAHLDSASPGEVTLIETVLAEVKVPRQGKGRPKNKPVRLIYDRAADSDPLRERLAKHGIELICPHRSNRVKAATQDGRSSGVTSVAGRWSDSLPGWETSAVWWSAGTGICEVIEPSSIWPAY